MTSSLANFWSDAHYSKPPYLHPKDRELLNDKQHLIMNYKEYVDCIGNNQSFQYKFHTNLLPQPYIGNIDSAKILILLSNPGLTACDYYAEENTPAYRKELIRTLQQDRKSHLFLDPQWAWTTGFRWWEGKLRNVVKIIAYQRFGGDYVRALNDVSLKIASIEYVPYHSEKFSSSIQLESSTSARAYVSQQHQTKTIICLRGNKFWNLTQPQNLITYPAAKARSASLSEKSKGGCEILNLYGIPNCSESEGKSKRQ